MAFMSYVLENDEKFKASLKLAAQASEDLRVPFSLILSDFYRSERAIFNLQGPGKYPDFGGLNPTQKYPNGDTHRDRAIKQKYRRTGGLVYPLLVGATGKLSASLTNPGAQGAIGLVGKNYLVIGTSIDYGIYHQSDATRKKIPLRKFLFIGPESNVANDSQKGRPTRWGKILSDHIVRGLKANGAFK